MKKHKFKALKSVTAVLLSMVLLAVSAPITLAAGGSYDPIPVFEKNANGERVVSAWLNSDDGVSVYFPQATAQKTNAGVDKTISFYILQLIDLGDNTDTQIHEETELLCKKAEVVGNGPYFAEITAAELPAPLSETHSYSVIITAVDSEGWMSENLHTIVSEVPEFQLDVDYEPLTFHSTAMREMMTFEGKASDTTYSDYGTGGGSLDRVASGETLAFGGMTDQVGVENSSGVDSQGYRLRVTGQPTTENPQTFDTAWSRQTWDFTGAQEVWFWMDLTQVSLNGLSFRLRANEKTHTGWADGTTVNQSDHYGDIIYSTTGYTGADAYVYLQQADGSWQKTALQNGTLDLADYRGYIRVPLQFICSTQPSYVNATNASFGTRGTKSEAYANSLKLSESVLVDAAGTPISNALLLQNRIYKYQSGINTSTYTIGTMLASGLGEGDTRDASNEKRATIENGEVVNRENAYKALEDLFAAGISYTGVSADSVNKSFFIDNILFYRTDGGAYSENALNGVASNTGNPVSDYYNQINIISKSIFNQIDTYVTGPDWGDYRAVQYIETLIEGYKKVYQNTEAGASWLEDAALAATAASLNMEDSWNRFLTARDACIAAGTYDKINGEPDVLVPEIERTLEKLPEPSSVISMSDELENIILHLHQIYAHLNLGQLDALGNVAEQKLLDYFTLIQEKLSNSIVVGQALSDNPFIPFNTFENAAPGTRAWQLENDTNAGSVNTDYRYTKGFLTYTTTFDSFAGRSDDTVASGIGSVPTDPTKNGFNSDTLRQDAARATVTQNGFKNTNGATITLDSQYYTSKKGEYNVLSVSYQGAEADSFSALRANNTGVDTIKLGALSKGFSSSTGELPLSLIFYADFSEIKNFRMAATISTYINGAADDFVLDMGSDQSDRTYYLLDPDSGEWVTCHSLPMYAFRSMDGENGITMDNYKGYVMIPLYHFKRGPLAANTKLDEHADALNSIYRISIGIAPDTGAAATEMDGKSYTIDNIGFGYATSAYADEVASRGITDATFDTLFESKSLPAEQFENAVNSIDSYDKTTLAQSISDATAMYDALGDYQKTLDSVIKAKARLDRYNNDLQGIEPLPIPLIGAPANLTTQIASLPALAREASTSAQWDLPYPGFVSQNGALAVNYAAYGIDAETADNIISMYEESYTRYSAAQKAMVTNNAELINAYNAARRCKNLETMLAKMQGLKTQVENVYSVVEDSTSYTKLENRSEIESIYSEYKTLDYFAKQLITSGTFDSTATNFSNLPSAFEKLLKNSDTYTLSNGQGEVQGGLVQLQAEYQSLFDTADTHFNDKSLFSNNELVWLKETIEEYNAFIPVFNSIYELKQKIDEIIELFEFDERDAGFANDAVLLTTSNNTGTANFQITYSEQYPIPTNQSEQYSLRVRTQNGQLTTPQATDTAEYKISFNGASYESAEINTGGGLILQGYVTNNTSTPQYPQRLDVGISFPNGAPVTSYTLSDTVYVDFMDATGTNVLKTYSIPVSYTMEESYTIAIPAEIPVSWDDTTPQDVSYRVTSALNLGSALEISIAGNSKLSRTDTVYTLDYTSSNFSTATYSGINNAIVPTLTPTIAVSGFDAVPVSEYRDTLTYSVTYTPNS